MEYIYVYDAEGFTGKYYGFDEAEYADRDEAISQALDRMVDQENLELGENMGGYLYPMYSADYPFAGQERGYVTAPDSPGYRHVTWDIATQEEHTAMFQA